MIKLVAVDMDGTFARDDKTYDRPKFKALLQEMTDRGMIFAVASGNAPTNLASKFDADDLEHIYLAGDNGNLVMHQGKIIRAKNIDRQDLADYVATVHAHPGFYCLLSTTSGISYAVADMPDYALAEFSKYNLDIRRLNSPLDLPEGVECGKIACYCDHSLEDSKAMMRDLRAKFPSLSVVTSGDMWLDAFPIDGGKGAAIAYFQDKFGIKPEESIAFGDSLNDVTMMSQVKYGMAMAQSDPEFEAHCSHKVGSNNDEAVLSVLEEVLVQGEDALAKYALKGAND